MARFERNCRRPAFTNTALLRHGDGDALRTVRRLLGRLRELVVEVAARFVVVLVLVVERLQREAPVSLFAAASPLRYVRIVLSHSLCLVDL